MPFCPRIVHGAACFWTVETNTFIFPQALSVTLRDVCAITGLPTIDYEMIEKLKDAEITWIHTLNATPSSYSHLYYDVSTAKNLSLEEEHKYFLWSFIGQFIFYLSGAEPIIDMCPIMAVMSSGNKFCLAYNFLRNGY